MPGRGLQIVITTFWSKAPQRYKQPQCLGVRAVTFLGSLSSAAVVVDHAKGNTCTDGDKTKTKKKKRAVRPQVLPYPEVQQTGGNKKHKNKPGESAPAAAAATTFFCQLLYSR